MNTLDYSIELRERGYLILDRYYDNKFCEKAISEIDEAFLLYKEKVESIKKEGLSGDQRIFGIEKFSENALQFKNDKFLTDIVLKASEVEFISKFILAGKVEFRKGVNTNSGGDWHRDSDIKQYKIFLYLTNVGEKNGPFMLIPKRSFNPKRSKKNITLRNRLLNFFNIRLLPPRFENNTIMSSLEENDLKIEKVIANRGTVFICDTSLIHKGDIIQDGERYSFTNYLYQNSPKVIDYIDKKFQDKML